MAVAKQFQQLVKITNGTTAETDVKLSDPLAMQHIDITSGANSLNQISWLKACASRLQLHQIQLQAAELTQQPVQIILTFH